ncbi:S9 family peptidase [Nocardia sp. CS682]|uniref:alpha/beta hydrolase family protein n=1 Tax=Nocardia sp. CS682 TaxID=1047172 RepID=UPI001074EEDE|nr:prolyl oligopeptidase family serine peptidase [Nocardia sp. CS682]QBS44154.1 dipeptidyl aminopeptidase [Nocardia sp. CS682]
MTAGRRFLAWLLSMVTVLAASWLAAPSASAEPECAGDVAVQSIAASVDGEQATGRVYEPYRCNPGDLAPRTLIVAVHGYSETAASYPDVMSGIARRTGAALLTLDQRAENSVWKPGEFNPWAGWQDAVAITQQYKAEHPSIGKTVLWGWSQGGMTAGLAVANGPAGLFDYWVDAFAPTNIVDYWNLTSAFFPAQRAQIERDAGGCTPQVCPQAYTDRSLVALAPKIDAERTFLIHGIFDVDVPYQHSVDLKNALIAAGKPYSMYTVVTDRGADGSIQPGVHDVGPTWRQGICVVERVAEGLEPLDGAARDYVTNVLVGVDTAPPPPPGAACAG